MCCNCVMGELAVSRAIGDHFLRPYVIAEPEVTLLIMHPAATCMFCSSWHVGFGACGIAWMLGVCLTGCFGACWLGCLESSLPLAPVALIGCLEDSVLDGFSARWLGCPGGFDAW